MITKSHFRNALGTVLFLGLTATCLPCSAQCKYLDDVVQGGIWLYPTPFTNWSMTIINLTPYQLESTPRDSTINPVSVNGGAAYSYPFQGLMEPIRVDPYRGIIWKSRMSQVTSTNNYYGRMRFHLVASSWTRTFEVNFAHQNGYGTAGVDGTWIALAQTKTEAPLEWTNDQWCAPGGYCGGVWATTFMKPLNYGSWSVDMRNIMTLTTDNVVVALYSPDNLNVILVVRDTSGGADSYQQIQSEWVDNNGTSVPGPCNRK
jgi:hypothetical protein